MSNLKHIISTTVLIILLIAFPFSGVSAATNAGSNQNAEQTENQSNGFEENEQQDQKKLSKKQLRKQLRKQLKRKRKLSQGQENTLFYIVGSIVLAGVITLAILFPVVVIILQVLLSLATIAAGIFLIWGFFTLFLGFCFP
jgi:Flp pilus assembly protein TadB